MHPAQSIEAGQGTTEKYHVHYIFHIPWLLKTLNQENQHT